MATIAKVIKPIYWSVCQCPLLPYGPYHSNFCTQSASNNQIYFSKLPLQNRIKHIGCKYIYTGNQLSIFGRESIFWWGWIMIDNVAVVSPEFYLWRNSCNFVVAYVEFFFFFFCLCPLMSCYAISTSHKVLELALFMWHLL